MNTDFDFKVGKFCAAIEGGKKEKTIHNRSSSAAVKSSTCLAHAVHTCLLDAQLHCYFFHWAWIVARQGTCSQLTCWWLKGVQTITSIISIFKIDERTRTHLHTFYTRRRVPTPTRAARVRVYRVKTHAQAHTRIRQEKCLFLGHYLQHLPQIWAYLLI